MSIHPLHDQVGNVTMREVRDTAIEVVTVLEPRKAAEQMVGLACLFNLVCERYDYNPRTALQVAENVLKQAEWFDKTHFEGLRMYLRNEL